LTHVDDERKHEKELIGEASEHTVGYQPKPDDKRMF
jgi:hypothetical protein